jgi:hypothetical protein
LRVPPGSTIGFGVCSSTHRGSTCCFTRRSRINDGLKNKIMMNRRVISTSFLCNTRNDHPQIRSDMANMRFSVASIVLTLLTVASNDVRKHQVAAGSSSRSAAGRNFGLNFDVMASHTTTAVSRTNGWFLGTGLRGGSMGTLCSLCAHSSC